MQPVRYITRHTTRSVSFIEGDCSDIDPIAKCLTVKGPFISNDVSFVWINLATYVLDNTNDSVITTVKYDHLVIACGAENATFGIPGVKENACFLKEAW